MQLTISLSYGLLENSRCWQVICDLRQQGPIPSYWERLFPPDLIRRRGRYRKGFLRLISLNSSSPAPHEEDTAGPCLIHPLLSQPKKHRTAICCLKKHPAHKSLWYYIYRYRKRVFISDQLACHGWSLFFGPCVFWIPPPDSLRPPFTSAAKHPINLTIPHTFLILSDIQ